MSKNKIISIVYYHVEDLIIECEVSSNNISIKDSYLVKKDERKKEIIRDLLQSFYWFREKRTEKDMLDEWRVHNLLYSLHLLRNHTTNTDLELNQTKVRKFLYKLVSKITHKNI